MPPRFLRRLALPVLLTIHSLAFGSTEPRMRVLIVEGFSNHDWRLTTALIRGILEPTGLFDVSVSTAPPAKDSPGWNEWRPRFADFDIVIQTCNDIWGGPSWPRAVQEDFENFVRNGGGVYVWHSGNNAFADWPAYNEMIGLGWRAKDFGTAIAVEADGTLTRIPAGEGRDTGHGDRLDTVVHRLGDHPIHAGLPRAWKTPDIEVYYYARGPANDIEVLSHGFDPVTEMNWPLEWTVRYGGGRVYTSTFGHVWKGDTQPERMRCAGLQTVVVRALQWLAGRPVDFPVPPDFPTADKISVRGDVPLPAPSTTDAGWTDLLAGGSTAAWRSVHDEAFPRKGWSLRDGVLTIQRAADPSVRAGGDIITRARYGNFELELEFRLTPGSNSGIKFHVQRDLSVVDGATGQPRRLGRAVGPEFQLLDDETHPDARGGRDGNRMNGSLYDLIPAADKISKPIGEWNQARVIARGPQVEFWLNGKKTLEYDRHSAAFRELVAQSKYHNIPDFAAWPDGHILLQDHDDEVSFRNVRLRELQFMAVAPDPNFHIFLCLGQSNMEGFPGIPDEDKAFADPRFQMLAAVDFPALGRSKGNWYVATPPLCRPNSGLSPADYFGRTLLEHLPADARVGVVNVSVAGARIEVYDDTARDAFLATAPDWMRGIVAAYGGNPYRQLVAMAKRAQRAGVIRGILLHQGEANTGDPEWPAKVKLVYENLLRDLDLRAADVPLLAGELVGADQNGACASMNTIIARLPDTISAAHVVSSAGCAARDDRLHFKPEGYRELGRRFAHAMLPLLELPGAGSSSSVKAPAPLYLDPAQPQAARIQDLIARMTLEEKAAMMSNGTPGIPRLGIPKYDWWSEALHGVANSGTATVFPQAIGLAAMWNADLHREMAGVIGIEGRAKFNGYIGTPLEGAIFRGLTFWSPNINIFRDPRWGRGQETYGEDPFLTSRLGVAFVRGLQGDHPDYLLAAACAKHYAVHSGPEPLRHNFDVSPSDADLFETYLPAFEALVREARVEAVMTAYNAVNGTPASISPLLYSLLESWDFDGHVVSDCGSVDDLHRTYKAAADPVEANALTLRAGMHLRCGNESEALANAVRRGLVTERELDDRLASLLRTMFRLGFFDPKDKVPFRNIAPTENDTPAHGALALRAARESMVLLKNDGILPLDTKRLKRVAVIGPNATSVPALLGNYNGSPSAPVTLLAGLKAALEPAGVQVDYAHGCDYALRPTEVRLLASGWVHGEYFANPALEGAPVAKRTERPLNSDWGDMRRFFGGRPGGVPEKGISARWNGDLHTTLSGDYELVVRGRGGFRLFLDGEAVIDSWTPPSGEEAADRRVSVMRHLPDNAVLPLRLEYRQGDGPVKVAVDWNTPAAGAGIAAALETARDADVIVFIGGISAQLEGEEMNVDYDGFVGGDRLAIELPEIQQELLKKLHATGKPIVFVNLSGSAVALPWADENVNAILQAWYPGQAGGTAVADVLLGNYNPAGRLPVTFYRATADMPDFKDYKMDGRTYRYFSGEPLYAFGHGLSYSQFRYDNLRATPAADGTVAVTLDVTNTGERDGDEVVQLYATPPASSNPRERHALCGFDRIHIKAGETKRVSLTVPSTALRRWNDAGGHYAVPIGEWNLGAGSSSADIRQTIAVKL